VAERDLQERAWSLNRRWSCEQARHNGRVSIVLVTGANKGLGREAARRLVKDGHDVWAGARDPERGRAAAGKIGARALVLDVTDEDSVRAAAQTVAEASGGALDVLVNNAGISGGRIPAAEVTAAHVQAVYDVNVLGPVRMLHAFLPLLERSSSPVVVNVSSGLGSLAGAADVDAAYASLIVPAYRSSKAALNMLTLQYAAAFPALRINAVDPGYTATDLNAHAGTQTIGEGTDAIVQMASIGSDGPTGTFVSRDGQVPW
jgi:NAD(P)-dependent dehydrogenase (short-subunit alcohol dehydrogenase family)